MNPLGLISKFQSTLPIVREWIEKTLDEHQNHAIPVINLPFPLPRLKKVFPSELLSRAKAVVVTGKVPFPPLSSMGLPELAEMENMDMDGITYKDTFFVSHLQKTESLHFHEMIHIVQWARLGVENFLLAYGAGLMQFGYENSPLEKMAYSLQASFDGGALPPNLIELIQHRTDAIWNSVAPLFSKV